MTANAERTARGRLSALGASLAYCTNAFGFK